MKSTKTLIHAFVSLHLDYCNALFFGVPKYHFVRLQKVQNAAARVIFQIAKRAAGWAHSEVYFSAAACIFPIYAGASCNDAQGSKPCESIVNRYFHVNFLL